MQRIERWLSNKIRRYENWRDAEYGADHYLEALPPLPEVNQLLLDNSLGTTIQVFSAENPHKFALLIPGFGSRGQSPKYDWLIADLVRNDVNVARINNTPTISLKRDQFKNPDEYVAAHQEMYKQYMFQHLGVVAHFLEGGKLITEDTELHIIASSAGATAILAMPDVFRPHPKSLVLLGPSGDIDFNNVKLGIEKHLASGGKVQVIVGEYDHFKRVEPFLTLHNLSAQQSNVGVSQIKGAEHDLRWDGMDGGIIQLGLHRECLKSLNIPYKQLDEISGVYSYTREL